jgi:hypothetical protein
MLSFPARRHHRALTGIWTFVALAVVAHALQAQGTTGKLQGEVRDPTGAPLANAQVLVLGTAFAALTDDAGFYFINNVPAGAYEVQAQFIGYQAARMRDVRILADQTLTADFRLTGAVVLEAITITAAVAPIVPRDQVTTKRSVIGDQIDALPVDDPFEVVQLQPGVNLTRGNELSIRGGRGNEATVFVDGVPVRQVDQRTLLFDAPTNALAEASLVSGAMETVFGDAQSGIVSLVTRSGGPQFQGTFAYETDGLLAPSQSNGLNRFEAALSGPVLGNLTFSLGGTVTGVRTPPVTCSSFFCIRTSGKGAEESPYYTFAGIDTVITQVVSDNDRTDFLVPAIVQVGGVCDPDRNRDGFGTPIECQGKFVPYFWETDLRLSGRLQYTYGRGSRISLSALNNTTQSHDAPPLHREASYGERVASNVFVLNWLQQVARSRESELVLDLSLSYQTDRYITGAVERAQGLDLRDPALGIVFEPLQFVSDWDRFTPGDPATHMTRDSTGGYVITRLKTDDDWDALIENRRYDRGTQVAYAGRFETIQTGRPRVNPWGMAGITEDLTGGLFDSAFRYERRWVGRFIVDWQSDRYNRFKIGAEGTASRIGNFNSGPVFGGGRFYTADPYKFGLFAQDRVDLGDVVIELGLRYDQYSASSLFPTVPGLIHSHPAFVDSLAPEDMTCPDAPEDCNGLDWIWYRSRSHSAFSPRVRVSFPITDRTGFRFSYAHQTQTPFFENLYGNNNAEGGRFGGDVDFARTIQIEFGLRHAFSPDLVLDVAAYNKDKLSDYATRFVPVFDPLLGDSLEVMMMTTADFGTVRGIEFQLLVRRGRILSAQASYTLQQARSTGSDPFNYVNAFAGATGVTLQRQEPPSVTLRTRDDRTHSVQGTFAVTLPADFAAGSFVGHILSDVGVFGTAQLRSGLPYTRALNEGIGYTSGGGRYDPAYPADRVIEPAQSSETPWERFFDLRVTKGFRLGPTDWTLYADVRNVLNFTNKPEVFSETGDVVNDLHREREFAPELTSLEQAAQRSDLWVEITKSDGGTERRVGAVDLRDLSTACPAWLGSGGTIGCVMLHRTERRFGNGDGIYDVEEQLAALNDWYASAWGPSRRFYGPGRQIRAGVQLAF